MRAAGTALPARTGLRGAARVLSSPSQGMLSLMGMAGAGTGGICRARSQAQTFEACYKPRVGSCSPLEVTHKCKTTTTERPKPRCCVNTPKALLRAAQSPSRGLLGKKEKYGLDLGQKIAVGAGAGVGLSLFKSIFVRGNTASELCRALSRSWKEMGPVQPSPHRAGTDTAPHRGSTRGC